jgi:hypothetical protein
MKKNKGLKICLKNKDAIEKILLDKNGRAWMHCFTTYNQIVSVVKDAESKLDRLGLPKTWREGAIFKATSGMSVCKAYTYSRNATEVVLKRKRTFWQLIEVNAVKIGTNQGGGTSIFLKQSQDEYLVKKFKKNYRVINLDDSNEFVVS